jgi:predicted small lipoprotein YifL
LLGSLSLFTALSLAACGGGKGKEANDPAKVVVDNEDEMEQDGAEFSQEFGGMNEEKVTKTFKRVQPDLVECLTVIGASRDYLVGEVGFLVTVDDSGKPLSAHMERSNLGNYAAERCMIDILLGARWPKPVGGRKGLARSGMTYDPGDVRPPVQWTASDIESTLTADKNASSLAQCGGGGPFEITAYVSPQGKVLSAGVAHTDDNGEETAACLVSAVEGMVFGSPGSWRAKVTFRR